MSTLNTIQISNLRALGDSPIVPIKPITLLVGRNSVGKSTFARFFPLLRQSYEEQRRAPILWWGKFVDFGTFDEAVNRDASTKEIKFSFEMTLSAPKTRTLTSEYYWHQAIFQGPTSLRINLVLCEDGGNTYVRSVSFQSGDLSISMTASFDGFVEEIVAGDERWVPSEAVVALVGNDLIPTVSLQLTDKADRADRAIRSNPFIERAWLAISAFAHGNTKRERLQEIVNRLSPLGSARDMLTLLQRSQVSASFRSSLSKTTVDDKRLTKLRNCVLMMRFQQIAAAVNAELQTYSRGVRYLEPIRAVAQRYYRVQELAVNEVDSKGSNLAILVHSMDAVRLRDFNDWLKRNMGFTVSPQREGGHISLRIKFVGDRTETNLADTGFGMSQVLPIAIQLWTSLSPQKMRTAGGFTSCFVVEQPELHLHPAFQAQIADLFVAAINTERPSDVPAFPIVAETHSSNLVNRLGELVAEGKVSREAVQVVLFEQKADASAVSIQIAEFDDDGVLTNWPFGFFSTGRFE